MFGHHFFRPDPWVRDYWLDRTNPHNAFPLQVMTSRGGGHAIS